MGTWWRHNFRKIAIKNCEKSEKSKKSAEKFVRTILYRQQSEF